MKQPTDPEIRLVDEAGEVTLYIAGAQAMQAWETQLMHRAADLLCTYGDTFLEVGLGLGFSALRIARNPGTKQHTVLEKYTPVIQLFLDRQREPLPECLEIVPADIFDYIHQAEPESVDGIFFDPEFPPGMLDDRAVMDELVPGMLRLLRRGGAFIPFFSVTPVLIDRYVRFFNKVFVAKYPFETYANTNYTGGIKRGEAFIQCFIKD